MNYKSFKLEDWIEHINGVIEDETTLDGNEMRDLVEFLSKTKEVLNDALQIIYKRLAESEDKE